MLDHPLTGKCVLVLEDEFLIALDVEQLCRDHGAANVVIIRSLEELGPDPFNAHGIQVAIVDVMLAGRSTVEFARNLLHRNIPFVFATGYSGGDGVFEGFSDVTVVGKPYVGAALMDAVGVAIDRQRKLSGCV